MRKNILKLKKLDSPYYNIPVHTHNTMVRVRGMPQCAEIHYRTHTHKTHDLKPTGFPIPVTNPSCKVCVSFQTPNQLPGQNSIELHHSVCCALLAKEKLLTQYSLY